MIDNKWALYLEKGEIPETVDRAEKPPGPLEDIKKRMPKGLQMASRVSSRQQQAVTTKGIR